MRSPIRLFSLLCALSVALLAAAGAVAWHQGIPVSAAGMAAKNLCSGVFVAQRPAERVIADDILPASVIMQLATMAIDLNAATASASLPGTGERHAVFQGALGCTLLAPGALPDPNRPADELATVAAAPESVGKEPLWPVGNHALPVSKWPANVNASALQAAVDRAFASRGSRSTSPALGAPGHASTRAVVIAHSDRLLIERYGEGFDANTPQLGWSMAKTVLSILVWARFAEQEIPLDTPVVNTMTRVPRPAWIGNWQRDQRADISIDHLLTLRDGLDHVESYRPWSDVPRMLWSEPDIATWAGRAQAIATPGNTWRYSSAVSNLLSRALRDQFASDRDYWRYPAATLFEPMGIHGASMETDADGTFIGSSYLWAAPHDWARLGQLLLDDGQWEGRQLVPAGWREFALAVRSDAQGKRIPYGPLVWQTHDMKAIDCPASTELPADGLLMLGHWGQVVGIFPSHDAVIVRMGWTTSDSAFDRCRFLADVLQALGPVSNGSSNPDAGG